MRSSSNETGNNLHSSHSQDQIKKGHPGSGSLTVIGLGPGAADLITPQATAALEKAQVVAGYGLYLDLVPPALLAGRHIIRTGMQKELERVSLAADHAAQGCHTVILSSGDAGIYGMASLALEVLEQKGLCGEVAFNVVPGIPALAAAAALLGAPLTHDFAVISLSDLLTPWEVIETRLHCAVEADFVLVLYNPRSKKRHWQLQKALDIACEHRRLTTPTGLVRQAWRTGQQVRVMQLQDLRPEEVDMLSIVFIGNSATRLSDNRMLTPRGYMEKYTPAQ